MGGRAVGSTRLLLAVGASASVAAAVGVDVLAGEHPTHTLGLGLVVLAVAGVRLCSRERHGGYLGMVAGALVAQPALHATSKLGGGHRFHVEGGLLHVVVEDGPATVMQVVVSAAVVIAVALVARVVDVLIGVVCRPVRLLISAPPAPARAVRVAIDARREGTMLRWCGWSIRSARRGPPLSVLSIVTPLYRLHPSC